MKSSDIRQSFLDYFVKNGHQAVASSRLIPDNDPTLLFNNAGMNQFKNVFTGLENRDFSRAVSSQKCVRAGGKHNDLDNVGHTARHHTFFEMLGNFSFGDYFKKEAIHFAWEFLTKELQIPKDRLYVTCFEDDDEAAEIWHKQESIPRDRIYRFGEKDNFWRMGASGPCGPCSEIFFDLGPEIGGNPSDNVMGGEGDRYMEIWNLVFMQFDEKEGGEKILLPNPSIDTGSGLERMATVMQGELNNYHTDSFFYLIEKTIGLSGREYVKDLSQLSEKARFEIEENNVAFRVLADHARSAAFLIGDGVLPSNEGRGYVLRRILRRAIRYGRRLSEVSLLPALALRVIEEMGTFYPELFANKGLIQSTLEDEERRFLSTLDQGTLILMDELNKLQARGSKVLDGATVFKLYDTFGFPVDLTEIMADEKGFQINHSEFEENMRAAREKAKASWKGNALAGDAAHFIQVSSELLKSTGPTEFTAYDGRMSDEGRVVVLSDGKKKVESLATNQEGFLAFDKTCFYAESGGQVGDTGKVSWPGGEATVMDCVKQNDIHLLTVKIIEGTLSTGALCKQEVESKEHRNIAAHHSATHLLHSALKKVLGNDVMQAGSLVEASRLRFDFTYNKPITTEQIKMIEDFVNEQISSAHPVGTEVTDPETAQKKGAMALFGEKYGSEVRVVSMGPHSMELCGGTHVNNTAMIRVFKIVSESGVSAGVRRMEALAGDAAVRFLMKHTLENQRALVETGLTANWSQFIEGESKLVTEWVQQSKETLRSLEKEIQSLKGDQVDVDSLIQSAQPFTVANKKGQLVCADISMDDRKVLSELSDKIRSKIQTGLVVVIGKGEKSHPIIVSVSKDLVGPLHAGNILKEMAIIMGGKGGGRPDFAQGAGADRSKTPEAFQKAKDFVTGL